MIVVLKEVRTGRLQALRALRTLRFWKAEDEDEEIGLPWGEPIQAGLKDALDMVNGLPVRISIHPEQVSEFEQDFYLQRVTVSPPKPTVGDYMGEPRHGTGSPWVSVYFPGGEITVSGGVKDLADTIYRLLGDGYPEDKIVIHTWGGCGPGCGPTA